MSTTARDSGAAPAADDVWVTTQQTPEFAQLRKRLRGFVFPMTGLFLVWYLLYVLLAAYAPGFMGREVVGNINVGIVFGLLQFVSTFAITTLYVSFANKNLDPEAERIRNQVEGTVA